MKPSNKCNGMTYDANLGLIVCEHATSSLIRERDGRREVLASHFEGQGTQQPERRLRALRRLDLFFRSVVRPHAGLRRRAAAAARLSGRLSRAAGRRRAAASGRSPPVRAAERALLLARREDPLCQRHGALPDPGVRRQCRRHARPRSHFRFRHPLRARARRARRHEVRQRRQYLGHRAGRRLGLRQATARSSAKSACPSWSPICTGAAPTGAHYS